MGYRSAPPAAPLAPWVDAYWEVAWLAPDPWPLRVVPDGCVDLVLNLGPAITGLPDARHGVAAGGVVVVGMHRRFSDLVCVPGTDTFGIRFRAGGLARLAAAPPLHELTDGTAAAQAFAPALAWALHEHGVAEAPDFGARCHRAQQALLSLLAATPPPDPRLAHALGRVRAAGGGLQVAALAAEVCLSERQLERLFRAGVGASPKQLSEILRFHAAYEHLRAAPATPLGELAFRLGYYDAAHFSRTFKHYAGQTPSARFGRQEE